jgi:heptosyltransferase-2
VSGEGKILVIRGGALGDFIMTLPVLTALRQEFPQTEIHVMGYPHIASLAQAGKLAHRVHSIEAPTMAGFFARQGTLSRDLSGFLSTFDVILSYLYDPDEIFQENVTKCTNAQFIQGPHRPDESLNQPASQCLLQPLERLAIVEPDPIPVLSLASIPDRSQAPSLILHPGSGSDQKNWPEPQWKEFLQQIARETALAHWNFLMVGGEVEGERLDHLMTLLPPSRSTLARNLPLPELAAMMASRGRAFLGHDSGISHLAASLNIPGRILWGPTTETVWRPLGDHIRTLSHSRGLPHIKVHDVVKETRELLESVARR